MKPWPPPEPGALSPPPELTRLEVEDWIDPATFTPRWPEDATPEAWLWAAHAEARRLWKAARRAWLDEHQVPPASECEVAPIRSPLYRDEQAVREVFAARLGIARSLARPGRRRRGART